MPMPTALASAAVILARSSSEAIHWSTIWPATSAPSALACTATISALELEPAG